jgi:hypothetical protein
MEHLEKNITQVWESNLVFSLSHKISIRTKAKSTRPYPSYNECCAYEKSISEMMYGC